MSQFKYSTNAKHVYLRRILFHETGKDIRSVPLSAHGILANISDVEGSVNCITSECQPEIISTSHNTIQCSTTQYSNIHHTK